MLTEDHKNLIALAREVQEKAYVPYSKFAVGAALLTEDGNIFTGCNVENVSFGLTNCGERSAIFKMISEKGPKAKIKAIAVTCKPDIPLVPCGACRQVIEEFSTPETVVIFKGYEGFVSMPWLEHFPNPLVDLKARLTGS